MTPRFILLSWQELTAEEHAAQPAITTFVNYSCALSLEKNIVNLINIHHHKIIFLCTQSKETEFLEMEISSRNFFLICHLGKFDMHIII